MQILLKQILSMEKGEKKKVGQFCDLISNWL